MARTTHVKKAQQRYETVVVTDADGNPVKTPVMKRVWDEMAEEYVQRQKTTKSGRPVFMTQSVADKTKPKDPYTCDHCHQPIAVGTPYKYLVIKTGASSSRKMTRHEGCPSWQPWDYSDSLSAQLARISYDFSTAVDAAESPDDVQSALDDAATSVTEIAEQKTESASNIEEGFGHATSSSEELESVAEQLEEWAGEITAADIPEMTDCEDCTDGQQDCDACDGTGQVDVESGDVPVDGEQEECSECSGSGEVECSTCDGTGEDIDAWRDAVRDEVTIVDEAPV